MSQDALFNGFLLPETESHVGSVSAYDLSGAAVPGNTPPDSQIVTSVPMDVDPEELFGDLGEAVRDISLSRLEAAQQAYASLDLVESRPVGNPRTRAAAQERRSHPLAFACISPGCEGKFTSLTSAKRHVYAHRGIKLFLCSCNGYRSTTASDLKRHIKALGPEHHDVHYKMSPQEEIIASGAVADFLRQIKDNGDFVPVNY